MIDLKDLLFSSLPTATPHMGSLLISEPLMEDKYFGRSVVLVLDEPEGGGHFGLILNKPTEMTLHDLMPEWEEGKRIPIFCGGPVDLQRMFLLHTLGERLGSTTEVLPGIYVGADLDKIIEYIEEGGEVDGYIRFFLGYCGWSPGQLSGELNRKSWAVNALPQCPNLLKGEGVDYWTREVKDLGDEYRGWLIVPTDPSLN
ncbi:MAG: YqgE/AlgH family protein [Muribaculaceae bacterium]|nr:YqgE/AlgH family protein [Muribaculaceae bacterium]